MTATVAHLTTPDGVRLAHRVHAPAHAHPHGRTLLLLHGLAGHQGEWDDLVPRLLADGHRVVTYDARGHGASTRRPTDMSRGACVRDAATVIRELCGAHRTQRPAPRPDRTPPAFPPQPPHSAHLPHLPPLLPLPPHPPLTLVGQSLGGHTAFLTAAAHPELLDSLILIEAGPGTPDPTLPAHIAAWLDSWPTPFDSPSRAADFFGHPSWSRNLERRPDGWYPRAERAAMLAAVAELADTTYHAEWAATTCPTLVVRGAHGTMAAADAAAMPTTRSPGTRTDLTVMEEAGHDVHLDQPSHLHTKISRFLNSLHLDGSGRQLKQRET
ncbi:alpha/beta fold hydrolase [Streptomyces caniscabiei]|uniref:alpha/beta fold hydrolase n=2 Tax=Streptomyces caniscabiei TaxID=2746961 RepID=UPI0007660C02|nr:alpha/beta hydrolase [Streptomyces caniscabiei]